MVVVGLHLQPRALERLPVAGRRSPALRRACFAARGLALAIVIGGRLRAHSRSSSRRGPAVKLDAQDSRRPLADKWDRHRFEIEARQPGQQAQVHRHRRRHRPRRRVGRRVARRARLQRRQPSASRTARAARTASPRRAASTPPRTTRTTATASTGSSTTRSRAATSAPARPTSTASPQVSVNIIDQCVAQGVPFAREYGGLLDNRSFGGAQVVAHLLRPRPDRPAAPARRLPGADAPGRRRHGHACSRAARCSTSSSSTARRAASSRATS